MNCCWELQPEIKVFSKAWARLAPRQLRAALNGRSRAKSVACPKLRPQQVQSTWVRLTIAFKPGTSATRIRVYCSVRESVKIRPYSFLWQFCETLFLTYKWCAPLGFRTTVWTSLSISMCPFSVLILSGLLSGLPMLCLSREPVVDLLTLKYAFT
jgi:hypothetical protein